MPQQQLTATFPIPTHPAAMVCIEASDILERGGTKVIHCSRTFDTDTHVVRSMSVYGQWLKRCAETETDVDMQIDGWLDSIRNKGVVKDNLPYRKRMFASGELCPVVTDDGVVCLAGFCQTSNAFSSDTVTLRDYVDYWDNLWNSLSGLTIDKADVSVTVPGGKSVAISGCPLGLEQRLGIVLLSYFRFVMRNTPLPCLHVCIGEAAGRDMDFDAWKRGVMPYLWGFASLPILFDVLGTKEHKPLSQVCNYVSSETDRSPMALLMDDLREMIATAAATNGTAYEQHEGSKRVVVDVRVESEVLSSVCREIGRRPDLVRYFGKPKGNSYDRNALLQLLGTLIERSSCFGMLNRRSVMMLCLGGDLGDRWTAKGDSKDNIINYVGQRLKTFKTVHPGLYEELVDTIPPEWRRGCQN